MTGSTPVPRTTGPEHERQCNSPARSEVTVRARLGPQRRDRVKSIGHWPLAIGPAHRAGVAESGGRAGLRPRCTRSIESSTLSARTPVRCVATRLCGNREPSGPLPRGSEFESPGAYQAGNGHMPAHTFGSGATAAHLALNQEMGDRALPPELSAPQGTARRVVAQLAARGVRGAEGAGSSPANPTIGCHVARSHGALAQWESTGLSIRGPRVRAPHASPQTSGPGLEVCSARVVYRTTRGRAKPQ